MVNNQMGVPEYIPSFFPAVDFNQPEFQLVRDGPECHFCRTCPPDPNFVERPPDATLALWERSGCPGEFDSFDEFLEKLWGEPDTVAMFGKAKSGEYVLMCAAHFERACLLDQLSPNTVTLGQTAIKYLVSPWIEQFSKDMPTTFGEEGML